MNIEQVLTGYIECALWCGIDELNDCSMDTHLSRDDLLPETLASMRADVVSFCTKNETVLHTLIAANKTSEGGIGHDFWLTRNHHGAGFWDRGLGLYGRVLTKSAQYFCEQDLYITPEGKIGIE